MDTVTVDAVTEDAKTGEWALYLVEEGPWPDAGDVAAWGTRLRAVRDRILDAVDAAIDGGVAKRFPGSAGKRVRIQVDAPGGTPAQVEALVEEVRRHLATAPDYAAALEKAAHVSALRVVTGKEMGRFGGR